MEDGSRIFERRILQSPISNLPSSISFTDADQISGWAVEAMNRAVDSGLISGRGDGRLDPKAFITRAEAAALIQRISSEL